jgi:hypothetical protein
MFLIILLLLLSTKSQTQVKDPKKGSFNDRFYSVFLKEKVKRFPKRQKNSKTVLSESLPNFCNQLSPSHRGYGES